MNDKGEVAGGSMYRVEVIAKLFGVTVCRIQQLTQEGVLPTTETPEGRRYDLVPTIQKYVKYLSDSRRRWREPVLDIIGSGAYDRLHILTHAFWYHEQEESISETMRAFINCGNIERYTAMRENIMDLPSIMQESEVR